MVEIDINDPESWRRAREAMKERKRELMAVMEPFLSDGLDEKKQTELAHAAKFVIRVGATIEKMGEAPDFLIRHEGNLIGLEIRELVTAKVEYNRHMQRLFDRAANDYREKFPDEKMLATFWIDKPFSYKSADRSSIAAEIGEYVAALRNGRNPPQPECIDRCDFQPHSRLDFSFNEGAYFPEALTSDILISAISDKDTKFASYVSNSGTESQWLLLVNREAGSDAFDTEDFEGVASITTNFEHIYLLRDFDLEVTQIY